MPATVLKIFFIFAMAIAAQASAEEPLAQIALTTGQYPLFNTPVSVNLDAELAAFSSLRIDEIKDGKACLLYTSPSPRDRS